MRDFSPLSWLTLSIVASCSGRVDLESRNATGAEGGADASSSTGDTTLSNPVVIATGLIEPVLLASDGATLFINTSVPMGPLLTSMPVEGGARTAVAPTAQLVGVDSLNVYYLTQLDRPPPVLYMQAKTGGAPQMLSGAGPLGGVLGASVHSNIAYWVTGDATNNYFDVHSYQAQTGSTSVLRLQSSSWGPILSPMTLIAATTNTLFLSASDGIVLAPAASGTVVRLSVQGAWAATSDDQSAYFCPVSANSSLVRLASDGTMTNLAQNLAVPFNTGAIAVDDTYVYWVVTGKNGSVMKLPKQGGTPVVVATEANPNAITVDDTAIYWEAGGVIKRQLK